MSSRTEYPRVGRYFRPGSLRANRRHTEEQLRRGWFTSVLVHGRGFIYTLRDGSLALSFVDHRTRNETLRNHGDRRGYWNY